MKIIQFGIVAAVIGIVSTACPEKNVFEGNCYWVAVELNMINFSDAKTKCEKRGGFLARLMNQDQLQFVKQVLPRTLSVDKGGGTTQSLWIASESKGDEWTPKGKILDSRKYKRCKTLKLDFMSVVTTPCNQNNYPLCQISVKNCSMSDIQINNSEISRCKTFWTEAKWNTVIDINCLSGFTLHGSSKITCHANGSWSELPKCSRQCKKPTANGKLIRIYNNKKIYNVGEEILVVCVDGYVSGEKYLQSHVVSSCTAGGRWNKLVEPIECIPHKEVNCPAHMCQTIQMRVKEGDNAKLLCMWNHTHANNSNGENIRPLPHFYWIKNHEKVIEDSRITIEEDGRLKIKEFVSNDSGIYTCVKGIKQGEVRRVIIYVVKMWFKCDIDEEEILKSKMVREGRNIYLGVREGGEANVMNVAWFKNGERIWGDKKKIILPNGDLVVYNAGSGDGGFYTFEIEKEVDVCVDRTTRLVVIPQTSTICGLTEDEASHPWLVTIWWEEETVPFCYGSLVNENWVVTSAFCLIRFSRISSLNMSVSFSTNLRENLISVEKIVIHPRYSTRLNINDMALIKLDSPVTFNATIRPICISDFDFDELMRDACQVAFGFHGNVSGFGSLNAMDSDEFSVKSETMASVFNSKCQHHLVFAFPKSMFCAEANHTASVRRAGDTGSPFEVKWRGRVYLGGIFSWGERMSGIGPYDYFTKISAFYEWIQNKII